VRWKNRSTLTGGRSGPVTPAADRLGMRARSDAKVYNRQRAASPAGAASAVGLRRQQRRLQLQLGGEQVAAAAAAAAAGACAQGAVARGGDGRSDAPRRALRRRRHGKVWLLVVPRLGLRRLRLPLGGRLRVGKKY